MTVIKDINKNIKLSCKTMTYMCTPSPFIIISNIKFILQWSY